MADLDARKSVSQIDWEAFYANYRKPDYVPGYEIAQKLGAGAFGIVFKARKHSIGKDYAIKFLKVDDAAVRDAVLHELVPVCGELAIPIFVSDNGSSDSTPEVCARYANLVHHTRMPRGGHFAPAEEPELVVDDLRAFFRTLR